MRMIPRWLPCGLWPSSAPRPQPRSGCWSRGTRYLGGECFGRGPIHDPLRSLGGGEFWGRSDPRSMEYLVPTGQDVREGHLAGTVGTLELVGATITIVCITLANQIPLPDTNGMSARHCHPQPCIPLHGCAPAAQQRMVTCKTTVGSTVEGSRGCWRTWSPAVKGACLGE